MHSSASANKFRGQFSIRSMLVATAVLGMCFAIAALQYRRATIRAFQFSVVRPITDNFVSSVGYSNGHILWLRLNSIDPHHPNGYDEWIVPIEMDVSRNDGSFGPYKSLGDQQLKTMVTENPYIRALDLRGSSVSDAGLLHLSKLKQLEWLWLDAQQSTATGVSALHNLTSLRKIWLPIDNVDGQLIEGLRNARSDCRVENTADLQEGILEPEST